MKAGNIDSSADQEKNIPAAQKGLITNTQDYSVHDGYGLRLIVFEKGCPLRCRWCQNPETLNNYFEIEYRGVLCKRCGACLSICPVKGAIIDPSTTEDTSRRIDRNKCTRCGQCTKTCRWGALTGVGQLVTVEEILNKVLDLIPFFRGSGNGGITISGGEPLFQPQFTNDLLQSCKDIGVHTAIDTSGFARYEIFEKIANNCDLVLFDIKHMNDKKHIWGTGQSNKIIHENLTRFVKESAIECVVRVPLIPGFNDDIENIKKTAQFLSTLNRVPRLDLLPFNVYAESKYRIIGLEVEYQYSGAIKQTDEYLEQLVAAAKSYGLEVTTQGLW